MKKITLFVVGLLCAVQAYAQEVTETQTVKQEYVVSPIGDNWTVSVGAGAEFHPHSTLVDNLDLDVATSFQFDVSVGKWLTPYVGLRLKYAYSTFDLTSTSAMNSFIAEGSTTADGSISTLHADVLFDFTAMFGGYNPNRFYSVKPYAGVGFSAVSASKSTACEYVAILGILNEFRLSDPLSLQVDLGFNAPNAQIYGEKSTSPRFYTTSATLGLTYYFGKKNARKHTAVTETDSYLALTRTNETLTENVSDLESANAALASENEAVKSELETTKAQKANAEAAAAAAAAEPKEFAPVAIFFEINKSTVVKADAARLKYLAEMMKEHEGSTFVIEGYADSATGTVEYNQKLSQKRADAVCKVLVEKYDIDGSKLEAVGKGAIDTLFDDITLNRAAVVRTSN